MMWSVRIFVFMLVFLYASIIFCQQKNEIIADIFKDRGEIYFRIKNDGKLDLNKLTKIISIDSKTTPEFVYAYANCNEFNSFLDTGTGYEILPHPASLIQPEMRGILDLKEIKDWDFYPTYEAYVELMYKFELDYPELCDVFSIGTTVQGRQLIIAKISSNVNVQEAKPRFLYTSSIHGDETTGYVLMLRLIEYLLKNFGSDDNMTDLLKNMEIWINPLANPDGTYKMGNNTVSGATRYNANNVDLNRNYPDFQDGPHPDGNPWQKETIEFMELADSVQFVMSANFHGGAEVFNYPWDTWPILHADNDWWILAGREWADTIHQYAPSSYFTGFNNGITNGYAWYEVDGGRQDYMNYFHHCREVTVEISDIKMVPSNFLPDYWEYNYRSFINYMKQALYGITGTVVDSETELPIRATIEIKDHDINGSWVLSDSLTGRYFRPLYEGVYSVTYSAPKYASQTIENVEVKNYQQTKQDIQMVFTGSGTNGILFPDWFSMGPIPSHDHCMINYLGNEKVNCLVELIDFAGKSIWKEGVSFSPSFKTLKINTSQFSQGIYFLNVSSEGFWFANKLVIR